MIKNTCDTEKQLSQRHIQNTVNVEPRDLKAHAHFRPCPPNNYLAFLNLYHHAKNQFIILITS